MRQARGEVTTSMVDLSQLSLTELLGSADPMLLRSIQLVAGRIACSRTGVLDNQAPQVP
jgi:hypothetical protein